MRRRAAKLAGVAIAVGLALAAVAAVLPVPRARVLDAYILFVGGLVLLALVQVTRGEDYSTADSPYERALRRREPPPNRPAQLARIERTVALAAASSFDLHYRLRPLLREIAAHRLASRRGVDLDGAPAEARAVLGEELWDLVRPDREPPDDRLARGLPLARVRSALAALERV